eukprot:3769367-Rhodomonas_salina.2
MHLARRIILGQGKASENRSGKGEKCKRKPSVDVEEKEETSSKRQIAAQKPKFTADDLQEGMEVAETWIVSQLLPPHANASVFSTEIFASLAELRHANKTRERSMLPCARADERPEIACSQLTTKLGSGSFGTGD